PRDGRPGLRDRAHRARHDLRVDAHGRQPWQQHVELPEAHQRLTADERQVDGAVLAHGIEDAVDERLALEIGELAQRDLTSEVVVAVRVAARTTQRTLARDFYGQVRAVALENSSP